ncbi:TylF/MycF/NovP-related O-methyltransferase [Tropicimonas sp. S265A]|uniref:TylF/MycF/NovP-related O-methyltransferase n=1 Tax=Tropicimonas sp. S265A TaxID=3415134 RepID=UPI003C7ED33F
MFKRAKASIAKLKQSMARQEEHLAAQTDALHRIAAHLGDPALGPGGHRAGVPDDFDPAMYLALNRDVAAAKVDATHHFLNVGENENRHYRPNYMQDGLITIHNTSFQDDPAFQDAYARGVKATGGQDYNWHWRVHVGLWAARCAVKLPGDFVECGVNKGFLSSSIMHDLKWNDLDRTFWLLDTFAGIDTTGVSSEKNDPGAEDRNRKHFESGLYTDDVSAVRENFAEWKNVQIVVGAVPGTLDKITSEQIAFASIDMNTAPPEIAAMEFLWSRLVPGAMVVLDDFNYRGYEAQHVAMTDFAKARNTSVLSLPTGQGLLVRPPND